MKKAGSRKVKGKSVFYLFEYEAVFKDEENPEPVINTLVLATAEGKQPPEYYLLIHNPDESLKKVKDVFVTSNKFGNVLVYNERFITKENKQMFATFHINLDASMTVDDVK